jgi:hypothetical protein
MLYIDYIHASLTRRTSPIICATAGPLLGGAPFVDVWVARRLKTAADDEPHPMQTELGRCVGAHRHTSWLSYMTCT